MPVEDEFIQIGGVLWGEPVQPQVVEDEQVGCEKGPEGTVSVELSTLAWAMALKKSSAWVKRMVCPATMTSTQRTFTPRISPMCSFTHFRRHNSLPDRMLNMA